MAKVQELDVAPWMQDPKLSACSLEFSGMTLKVLWLLHRSPRRGFLVDAQGNLSNEDLAYAAGCSTDDAARLTRELLKVGDFRRDANDTFYSERMARDEAFRAKCSAAGKKGGGNPLLQTYIGSPKVPPKVDPKVPTNHLPGDTSFSSLNSSLGINSSSGEEPEKTKRQSQQIKNARFTIADAKNHPRPMTWPPSLNAAWEAWIEMRFSIKGKHPTPRALDLALGKLGGWDIATAEEALNASTVSNWTDIYEPQKRKGSSSGTRTTANGKHDWAEDANISIPVRNPAAKGRVP